MLILDLNDSSKCGTCGLHLAASNNSFNASGNSSTFIVNLVVPQLIPAALIRALGAT
jgi:hypothetical protein